MAVPLQEEVVKLKRQLELSRNELQNIRKTLTGLKHQQNTYISEINEFLVKKKNDRNSQNMYPKKTNKDFTKQDEVNFNFKAIGYLESWFTTKNGTPRQACICPLAKAKLALDKTLFTNPEHSLEGLKAFSHVWLIFLFHQNPQNKSCKAKVAPPRLDGKRIGLFSTRTPHRPNPIGLSLAKLEDVQGSTVYLSGIDILNGTPILDIKPFIPAYDMPPIYHLRTEQSSSHEESENQIFSNEVESFSEPLVDSESCRIVSLQKESTTVTDNVIDEKKMEKEETVIEDCTYSFPSTAEWIDVPSISNLQVTFTSSSEKDLVSVVEDRRLNFLKNSSLSEVKIAITDILSADPRSVYRRNKCQDRLYFFTVDNMHLTCWFDNDNNSVQILKIKLI